MIGKIRLGLIGLGHMGRKHASYLLDGLVPDVELVGVCTRHPEWIREQAPQVEVFDFESSFLAGCQVDAVLICTPHKEHVNTALRALDAGKHVLVEKPVAADCVDVDRLVQRMRNSDRVVGVVFNQRMNPIYRRIKAYVDDGKLGEIRRVQWTMTAWYRSQAYYDSAAWRGTWAGEGGGVLLNQCSHHLDILHWLFGRPDSVQGICRFGVYHDVEVEDEATLVLSYPEGYTASFVASTGEELGINRLEIIGSRGMLCAEDEEITLRCLSEEDCAVRDLQSTETFRAVQTQLPVEHLGGDECCAAVLQQFAQAVRKGDSELVSILEARESLQVINAAIVSSLTARTVKLPLDEEVLRSVYASLEKGRTEVT